MAFLYSGFGSKQIKAQILFDDDHTKPRQKVERKKEIIELVQFNDQQPIKGKVTVEMSNPRKNFVFNSLKLSLIAQIGLFLYFVYFELLYSFVYFVVL